MMDKNNIKINKTSAEFLHPYLSNYEIAQAKSLIENLKSEKVFLSNSFNDNVWSFSHEYSSGRIIKLNFNKININLNKDELLLIKCWICSLLESNRPSTCIHYFHYFSEAVNITKFFSVDHLNNFLDWLHDINISNNKISYLLFSIFNFFEYSEIPSSSNYLTKLNDVRNKIKFKKTPIQLPSSKNILIFSYYLERFFKDIQNDKLFNKDETNKKTILFYPILIWWNLTTIIPIRSTEFCLIKRNDVFKERNKYFINITRIKNQTANNNHDNYYNKIEINKEIFSLIKKYVDSTNKFGETKTLISYKSLVYADNTERRKIQKRDLSTFNQNNLEKLLKRFYKEVINEYYQINLDNDQMLTPNDTRHIAFVSLMMQGVSPTEIARLGGHRTIAAQYHYSFHKEYWIDNEVFKLIKNYKNKSNINNTVEYIPDNIKLKAFLPPRSEEHTSE